MTDFISELNRIKRERLTSRVKRFSFVLGVLIVILVAGYLTFTFIKSKNKITNNLEVILNWPINIESNTVNRGSNSKAIDSLINVAINAVDNDRLQQANFTILEAKKIYSGNNLYNNEKAIELYEKCRKLADASFVALQENGDFALMDIPLNYYDLAQKIKPSEELKKRIDDCRTKYQKATAK